MEGDTFSGIGHQMRVLLTHVSLADVVIPLHSSRIAAAVRLACQRTSTISP